MSDNRSIDDLGFDPLDDALGSALRAAAPAGGDASHALEHLRPRLHRARRRHRTAVVGAAAVGAIALGAVAFAVAPGGGVGKIETPPATRPDAPTTTPGPSVTSTTLPVDPSSPVTTPAPGSTGPGGTTATSDDNGGGSNSGSGSSNSGSGSSNSGSGSGSSGSGSSGSGSGGSGSGSGSGSDD